MSAQYEEGFRAGVEAAAKVCEERLYHVGALCKMPIGYRHSGNELCAARIRALVTPTTAPDEAMTAPPDTGERG